MSAVEGTFIEGGAGRILVVSHQPVERAKRTVLVVPGFAEEMNKSRRLVWATAQALALDGCQTLVPDLYGTGDSEGDFADARWETWIDDLHRVVLWAQSRGFERFGVLLVRLGAALYADAEPHLGITFERAVAWQPVTRGADLLRQLLRMKKLSLRMMGGQAERPVDLEGSLLTGDSPMELGGYLVSTPLACAIERSEFCPTRTLAVSRGLLIELSQSPSPSAAVHGVTDSLVWQQQKVAGERFWLAVNPGPNAPLVADTARFLAA